MPARRIALVAAVTLALTACGGGSHRTASAAASSSGPTSSPPPTTTSALSDASASTATATAESANHDEQAVKTAYLAYWSMVDRLGAAPDPADPELPQRTANPALQDLLDVLSARQVSNQVTRLPADRTQYSHTLTSVTANGDVATVRDCFVDGRIRVDRNGAVVDDEVVTDVVLAQLARLQDRWVVSKTETLSETPGVHGCDD